MKSRLTRRDFLTTSAAALCGFMTTRDALAGTEAPSRPTPEPWPQSVRDFVESRQEREYRRLATALGLGSDPRRAYERLSRPTVLQQAGTKVKPPTSYEDPNRYAIMAIIFDGLQRAMAQRGVALSPTPLLATMPSGDVNARIVIEPDSRLPVIFFEQGLFEYLYGFALLAAWAVPPISLMQLSSDAELARIARNYTMPFAASQAFGAALQSYVVDGTVLASRSTIPKPVHNEGVAISLLNHMERFAMAHELAHIKADHLSGSATLEQEYEADALSLGMITTLAREDHGSWAVGYWACELELVALNLLYGALGVMAFGSVKPRWISTTHPDPLSRRERIRQIWRSPHVPADGVAAARELAAMNEALFQRLWEINLPGLMASHQKGVRPSPMWGPLIVSTFAESK